MELREGGAKAETICRQAVVKCWIQRLEAEPGDPLVEAELVA